MDYTPEELEDLATMRELRMRLRACAEARVAACEQMPTAGNWLDITRQSKAILAADRMVVTLYGPPPRRRARRSKPAQGSSFFDLFPLRGEDDRTVAGHDESATPAAETMPAKDSVIAPAPQAVPSLDAEDTELLAELTRKTREGINEATHRCAQWAGMWPDGARYNPEKGGWRKHTLTDTLILPIDDDIDLEIWIYDEILVRTNAIARHAARSAGKWPDGTPFTDSDPDYFEKSANFGTNVNRRADNEIKGPPRMPWWIVRKPPP